MNFNNFLTQLGTLVKNHHYGFAMDLYCKRHNMTFAQSSLAHALLRLSSGYTRAIMRAWINNGQLQLDRQEKDNILFEPVASPMLLYAGVETLLSQREAISPVLVQSEPILLIETAIVTLLTFDNMERGSKQQALPGIPLLVSELTPVAVAMLPTIVIPELSVAAAQFRSLDDLRQEGIKIIERLERVMDFA